MIVSGISRISPEVRIMEAQYDKTNTIIHDAFAHIIRRAILTIGISSVCYAVVCSWIYLIISIIMSAIVYILSFRYLQKNLDMKKIGKISFVSQNNGNFINIEDVYNTTLEICEMRGCVKTLSKSLDIYSLCTIFLSSLNLIIKLVKLIGGILT